MDMQTCYLIRNICIAVFSFFALIETIYSIRVKIWRVLRKHYGIERNQEMKKFQQRMRDPYNTARVRRRKKVYIESETGSDNNCNNSYSSNNGNSSNNGDSSNSSNSSNSSYSSNSSEMPVGRVVEPIVKPEVRVVREEEQTMLLDDFLEQKNEKSSKLKVKKNIILTT